MPFSDLRQFLAHCEEKSQLNRIVASVDPIDEMATIARESINRGGQENRALLFENMKGYEKTPLAVNVFTSRARCYMALETDHDHFHAEYARRSNQAIAPRLVKSGPCKDVILEAGKFSLLDFPVPKWHAQDSGRFITAACAISRDPETGKYNAGIYRHQVHGDDRLGVLAAPYRGIMAQAHKAWARGERLPVALVLGPDPSVYLATVSEWPADVDEMEMAGAFRQEPLDMVPCETIPLNVPATAEIVIEAELDPEWKQSEGPFGEFTGYYGGGQPQPYMRVKAITHRRQPIYHAAFEGQPPSSSNVILSLQAEAEVRRMVTVPGLLNVNVCGGSSRMLAIIQIDKKFDGHGKSMGLAVLAVPAARMIKTVIVVDKDVNPYNWTEVEWALAVRFQPGSDVEILKEMLGVLLDPSLPQYERETRASRTSKMVIDATQPLNVPYPPKCDFRPEVVERVRSAWKQFGLPY